MNRNLLQLVLRHADGLTADADADADAPLLRRFIATRDDAAFALLVKRHGPMVWAVCRQSVHNHADAEDAFQATFLALAQSARKVRNPERLGGWLHAAAVRICGKAKRAFTRRAKHERATAKGESDSPVSAAVWADLQAAVHAEVSGLPPSLRAVFVLCDLEGVEPTTAARQLGLKSGTLSGQLARARRRLLAALTKRGLAAGAVALGAAVAVPDVLANKVAGGVVPSAAVIALASEVTTMGVSKLKLLAAGLLVAGGLTLSGLGLLSKADGQPPPGGAAGGAPPGGVPQPRLPGGPGGGVGAPPGASPGGPGLPGVGPAPGGSADGGGPGGGMTSTPAAGEFLYIAKPSKLTDLAKLLKEKSAKGWEYTGPLDVEPTDDLPKGKEFEDISKSTRVVLVFKKKPMPMSIPGMGMGPGGSGGPGALGGLPGLGGTGSGSPDGGRPPVPGTGKGPGPGSPGGGTFNPLSGEGSEAKKPGKVVGTWKTLELQSNGAEVVAKGVMAVYAKPMPEVVLVAKGNDHVMVFAPTAEAHDAIADMVKVLDEAITKTEKPRK